MQQLSPFFFLESSHYYSTPKCSGFLSFLSFSCYFFNLQWLTNRKLQNGKVTLLSRFLYMFHVVYFDVSLSSILYITVYQKFTLGKWHKIVFLFFGHVLWWYPGSLFFDLPCKCHAIYVKCLQ